MSRARPTGRGHGGADVAEADLAGLPEFMREANAPEVSHAEAQPSSGFFIVSLRLFAFIERKRGAIPGMGAPLRHLRSANLSPAVEREARLANSAPWAHHVARP
jgi:hypothetical protein